MGSPSGGVGGSSGGGRSGPSSPNDDGGNNSSSNAKADKSERAAGPPGVGAPPSSPSTPDAPDRPDQTSAGNTDNNDDNRPASSGGGLFDSIVETLSAPPTDASGNLRSTSPVSDRLNNTVSYSFDEVANFFGGDVHAQEITAERQAALANGAAAIDVTVVLPSPREQISLYQADLRLQQRGLEYQKEQIGDPGHPRSYAAQQLRDVERQMAEIAARRDALDDIAMPDVDTGLTPEVLHFDPKEDGQIVVAYGDIANATHIGVMVPGMTTELNSFPLTNERAQDLMLALSDEAGVAPAVIGYLGYDAPDDLTEAFFDDLAVQGAPAFADFLSELPDDANVQVLAHSYGSLLTGMALAEGARPDAVHIFGSPGIGVDSIDELGLDGETIVTSTENPGDLVSWSERFGSVPPENAIEMPPMGNGHSEYFFEDILVDMIMGNRQAPLGGH